MSLGMDVCKRTFAGKRLANKQTVHSSIQKLEREGYLYLQQGRGRDKHICLTKKGKGIRRNEYCPSRPKGKRGLYVIIAAGTGGAAAVDTKVYKKPEGEAETKPALIFNCQNILGLFENRDIAGFFAGSIRRCLQKKAWEF